ncbi:MAG: hypothetical protein KC561_15860, partial [Myxococcales bacterium]|nr:hypothetical protein [Myxococcales bacterium]
MTLPSPHVCGRKGVWLALLLLLPVAKVSADDAYIEVDLSSDSGHCTSLDSWPELEVCAQTTESRDALGIALTPTLAGQSAEFSIAGAFPYGGDEKWANVRLRRWSVGLPEPLLGVWVDLDVEGLGPNSCDYGEREESFHLYRPTATG